MFDSCINPGNIIESVFGVPLHPIGQHRRAVTILEEPRAPVTVITQLSLYAEHGRSCSEQWYSEER